MTDPRQIYVEAEVLMAMQALTQQLSEARAEIARLQRELGDAVGSQSQLRYERSIAEVNEKSASDEVERLAEEVARLRDEFDEERADRSSQLAYAETEIARLKDAAAEATTEDQLLVIGRSIGRTTGNNNFMERARDVVRSLREGNVDLPMPTRVPMTIERAAAGVRRAALKEAATIAKNMPTLLPMGDAHVRGLRGSDVAAAILALIPPEPMPRHAGPAADAHPAPQARCSYPDCGGECLECRARPAADGGWK